LEEVAMTDERRFSRWGHLSGLVITGALVVVLAGAGSAAGKKPDPPSGAPQVSVVTMTSAPVIITTPGELYELTFDPESAVSFTQQPGQVITATMAASIEAPDWGGLFCDVHAAVNLTNGSADSGYTVLRQSRITQRGDVWWNFSEMGRDLTRSIPAPASATDHTVIGVTWMQKGDMDGYVDPDGDDAVCYGTEYGFEYQEVTVSVTVSVVTMQN
jgi:hypothetical protein